ncbi:MAG: TonB-dependent receptor [Burkholderiales bacterium]|nr:TonB-dependent receptor [Burkholderiales bacterium]MDE1928550.1 TonB-dependent receptor [Burkholderiales bacterium]MDE2157995.1 TonB-dependent receptor [Burkholderiales bacterium]MDE2502107.1 TonB-dependent receptor [Burkholderiales bacterium]
MSKPSPRSRCALALVVAAIELAWPLAAQAQDAATAGATTALAPIIVTAQHRAESAQVVPISITSVSGKTIEDSGFQSVTDLQYVVPGVQYDPTNGAAFQIRGVGSTSFDFSNEKSVSVVVDDVVMDAQRANGLIGLVDVDRVDVLMGPQGTLFGKNSTSGVISVTTANPQLGQFGVDAGVSWGERNDHLVNATANVPLGSQSALRVSAFDQGQDGPGTYTVLKRKLGSVAEYGYRAKLLFKPSNRFEAVLANDFEHHWDSSIRTAVGGASAVVTAAEIANGVTPGPRNADDADTSFGYIRSEEWGTSLHLRARIGADTLTSITAYRGSDYVNSTPADLVPGNVSAFIPFNVGVLNTSKYSEELRWASPTGRFLEYVAGLFYNKLDATQSQLQWATLGAPLVSSTGVPDTKFYALTGAIGQPGNASLFDARNTTTAAYGQLKFNFTKDASLALGLRETHDSNYQSLSYITIPSQGYTGNANDTFTATSAAPLYPNGTAKGSNFSYRISPQYKLGPDAMVYASYSTGYKPSGIAFVSNKYDPYLAETVKAWEIGEKAELLDHELRLNFDIYSSQFTDFQATTLTTIPGALTQQLVIGNAGGLVSRGAEGTAAWRASGALTLNANLTYTDAHFTNYAYNATTNYTNTRLTNAPRWSGFVGADYSTALSDKLALKASVQYSFRSKLWTVVGQPAYSQVGGYGLVNGRITLSPTDGNFEYGVYARNLFNRYFSTGWQNYGALGLLHYTSPDAYRTLGLFAKYTY